MEEKAEIEETPMVIVKRKKGGSNNLEHLAKMRPIKAEKLKQKKAEEEDIQMKLKEIEKIKKEKIDKDFQDALKMKEKSKPRPPKIVEVEEEEEEIQIKKTIPKRQAPNAPKLLHVFHEDEVRGFTRQTEGDLYRLSNEEILRRKLYEDVKRRVMRDLFN